MFIIMVGEQVCELTGLQLVAPEERDGRALRLGHRPVRAGQQGRDRVGLGHGADGRLAGELEVVRGEPLELRDQVGRAEVAILLGV